MRCSRVSMPWQPLAVVILDTINAIRSWHINCNFIPVIFIDLSAAINVSLLHNNHIKRKTENGSVFIQYSIWSLLPVEQYSSIFVIKDVQLFQSAFIFKISYHFKATSSLDHHFLLFLLLHLPLFCLLVFHAMLRVLFSVYVMRRISYNNCSIYFYAETPNSTPQLQPQPYSTSSMSLRH